MKRSQLIPLRRLRGFTTVEAFVAVTVLLITVLAVVKGLVLSTKSITDSRVRLRVVEFANADLRNFVVNTRVPTFTVGGDISVTFTPQGEAFTFEAAEFASPEQLEEGLSLALAAELVFDVGLELAAEELGQHSVWYPDQLESGEPSPNEPRFLLNRQFEVERFQIVEDDDNNVDEYKEIRLTLSDTQSPARFTPVTIETIVRRLDPKSLDLREAEDITSLTCKAIYHHGDMEHGSEPIAGVTARLFKSDDLNMMITEKTTGEDGTCSFPNLNPAHTYVLKLTKQAGGDDEKFWPEMATNIQIGVGEENMVEVEMWPIYYAQLVVEVRSRTDPDWTEDNWNDMTPLSGARILYRHHGVLPEPEGLISVLGLKTSWWNPNEGTDEDGIHSQLMIPIPQRGVTTYENYYIDHRQRTEYFDNPENIELEEGLRLVKDNPTHVNTWLDPYKLAQVRIKVVDNENDGVGGAYVTIHGMQDQDQSELVTGFTGGGGLTNLMNVRTNWMGNLGNTERDIKITVRKLRYQLGVKPNLPEDPPPHIAVDQLYDGSGGDESFKVQIEDHEVVVRWDGMNDFPLVDQDKEYGDPLDADHVLFDEADGINRILVDPDGFHPEITLKSEAFYRGYSQDGGQSHHELDPEVHGVREINIRADRPTNANHKKREWKWDLSDNNIGFVSPEKRKVEDNSANEEYDTVIFFPLDPGRVDLTARVRYKFHYNGGYHVGDHDDYEVPQTQSTVFLLVLLSDGISPHEEEEGEDEPTLEVTISGPDPLEPQQTSPYQATVTFGGEPPLFPDITYTWVLTQDEPGPPFANLVGPTNNPSVNLQALSAGEGNRVNLQVTVHSEILEGLEPGHGTAVFTMENIDIQFTDLSVSISPGNDLTIDMGNTEYVFTAHGSGGTGNPANYIFTWRLQYLDGEVWTTEFAPEHNGSHIMQSGGNGNQVTFTGGQPEELRIKVSLQDEGTALDTVSAHLNITIETGGLSQ